MNRIAQRASCPTVSPPLDSRPKMSAVFGTPPRLTIRLDRRNPSLRFIRRAFITSRFCHNDSWVGALLVAVLLFVAGTTRVCAADPLGTWTKVTIPDTVIKTPSDLIYVNGHYWATGADGRVQWSSDGETWHVVQTPSSQYLYAITHAQGRFVAVGNQQTILSSPNGTDWTLHREVIESPARPFKSVIYAGGKFVAVGGKGIVQYSTNGTDWTEASMPATVKMNVSDVTYGNGLYVASGESDGYYCVATSPDAVTWTRRYISVGWGFKAVGFFNGLFVAGNISELFTSPDGITWTELANVPFKYSNTSIADIKVVNGRLFAFGNAGLVLSSPDGTAWTVHETNTTLDIVALAYNGDRLLIFRQGIISSGNGPAKSEYWPPVAVDDPVDPVDPVDPSDPNATAQIANISTRAWIGTGDTKLITGFVVSGTTPKQLLIRGVGPTLAGFGVPGTIVDPKITLYNSASQEIATNNDWSTFADQGALAAETAKVFAFALNSASKDAAMLVTLQPGSYTLHLAGADGGTGVGLAEVYDCATAMSCRLINVSSRGFIGLGDNVAIPGFVVSGNKPKKLLVRGVGPTLGSFGVPGTIADPTITLYDSAQAVVLTNDNWTTAANQAELAAATAQVFAFALNAGSTDAAMLVTVNPGSYTAVVSGNNGGTGVALVEVYEVE